MKKSLVRLFFLSVIIFSCGEDDTTSLDESLVLPEELSGEEILMEFFSASKSAPYAPDQQVLFTFSNNSSLSIDQDPEASNGNELTLTTFIEEGSELIWDDELNGYRYSVSLTNDKTINEINVLSLSDDAFLGQFTEIQSGKSELDLIKALAGTYNVTSVEKGAHNRMIVSIDASGNIDFDRDIQFSSDTYALITDRRDCCNGIWIDMDPYPNETYPRLQLFVNGSGELSSITYSPNYPNSGGVEISF